MVFQGAVWVIRDRTASLGFGSALVMSVNSTARSMRSRLRVVSLGDYGPTLPVERRRPLGLTPARARGGQPQSWAVRVRPHRTQMLLAALLGNRVHGECVITGCLALASSTPATVSMPS